MSPPAKLAGMVLAGSAMYFLGVTLDFFRVPFLGVIVLSPDLVPLVTVLWVVGMANAINFIDGLDGLAAGITAIAAATYFLYATGCSTPGSSRATTSVRSSRPPPSGSASASCRWNFSPAKLFMGDSRGAAARAAGRGVDDGRRWSGRRHR